MEENYKNLLDEGIKHINCREFQKAIELISKSIELKNDWEISYFYRAVANHCVENFDDAILDYTKSIKLNPKMTDAYFNISKIILEKKENTKKELDLALDYLNKALELDENFIEALYAMAALQKKLGEYQKAYSYLERLLKIEPDMIHARALKKLLEQKYL